MVGSQSSQVGCKGDHVRKIRGRNVYAARQPEPFLQDWVGPTMMEPFQGPFHFPEALSERAYIQRRQLLNLLQLLEEGVIRSHILPIVPIVIVMVTTSLSTARGSLSDGRMTTTPKSYNRDVIFLRRREHFK